jgi:hypothetical protein
MWTLTFNSEEGNCIYGNEILPGEYRLVHEVR